MTGPTQTPPRRRGIHHGERTHGIPPVRIALAGGFWVLLLAVMLTGPQWAQWTATLAAFATAFVLIVLGEVGWERTVASARRAGLVAPPSDAMR